MATAGTITYPPVPAVAWPKDTWGGFAVGFFQYAGPASYAAGGDDLLPNQVKMGTIEYASSPTVPDDATGLTAVIYVYNLGTQKMQAFWGAVGALVEVPDTTDLSGFTGLFLVLGRG